MSPSMPPPAPAITCTFAGLALDRADALRADPAWVAARLADPASRFLTYAEMKPAMRVDGADRVPRPDWQARAAIAGALDAGCTTVFLGLDDRGRAHFALDLDSARAPVAADPEAVKRLDVRSAAEQLSTLALGHGDAAAVGLGRTLLDWHARHRFCARCGGATMLDKGGYARLCTDADCAAQHFPRVDPVVIMLPVAGRRCILGRQPRYPEGMYSALAGFVEAGESLEEAVARETREEAGIATGAVRYVASQPWPFPSNLMIGCLVEARSEALTPDTAELEDVAWFSADAVAAALAGRGDGFFLPPPMAIAHQLINAWLETL
ncbi:NAD+ diphosphatase [Rhodothalassium salexigens DSM 2132]|uniref:NAD(+) diphosphatase n=1 Tax=Rhodothalassium salexigens DSM 2132 TaxID=1188247 RepID=A0A4V6NQT9_RHOSA|nr:NAD(+) diphosphatase [Rhodothalassium salexigens]MBB4211602.1 NAD+ diphosphatase [Rhodothalassium salexigens DSM 2132]TCP34466.1 NAD+ diphosphatase [Rhodothalassium salexigens DSM 2132]